MTEEILILVFMTVCLEELKLLLKSCNRFYLSYTSMFSQLL